MRGLTKRLAHEVKRAQHLMPDILLDILGFLDLNKHCDLVFWAILLIGFFGMLRKSNLLPTMKESFDPVKQLMRDHIRFVGDMVIVKVIWAKNLQNRERLVEIPIFAIPESPLCPVKTLKALLSEPGKGYFPLFGQKNKVTFYYDAFQKKLRKTLKKAGYKEKSFSSHSMRSGAVTFAHCAGVPENLIQVHGDWVSDAYKNYLSFPLEVRALVSLKMRNKILKSMF